MRIESSTSVSTMPQDRRQAANEQLQTVFSEILAQSGRQGYASAEAYDSQNTLAEDIQRGWSDWFSVATDEGAYASQKVDRGELEKSYGEILVRSWNEGGYHDPAGFLQGLSSEELEAVQHVHHLANSIDVGTLTEEGAINLLIPPPAQVDVNRDGLTQVGKAQMIRFPDSLTPPSVVDAWNETTAEMAPRDKMIYQFRMKMPTLVANFQIDENGNFLGRREPGDPEYVNPMANPGYSYVDLTQQYLDSLDYFKNQIPREQYESQTAFWREFQQNLEKHGAR